MARRFAGRGIVVLSLGLVSACGAGFSLEKAAPDRALVTSAIAPSAPAPAAAMKDDEQVSDQATIRNAVSSADLAALSGKPLAWANAATGSRGEISDLSERPGTCRAFRATRESFDGVRLFRGETCLSAGTWRMTRFDPV